MPMLLDHKDVRNLEIENKPQVVDLDNDLTRPQNHMSRHGFFSFIHTRKPKER